MAIVPLLVCAAGARAAEKPEARLILAEKPDRTPTVFMATPPRGQADGEADAGRNEELEALVAQALDQKTDLKVEDEPIRDVVQKLAEKTGIPIELAPGTVDYLPYGPKTKLSATIKGHPLGESLEALFRPLGLKAVPGKGRVVIKPSAPLARMNRRATWEEVATLERLYNEPWSKELFDSLQFQFQDSPAADVEENRAILGRLASAVGAGSAARVLELACLEYGWAWFPENDYIRIITQTKLVEEQLTKRVSLRYDQISLVDALVDVTGRAGVLVRFDPGVLNALPPQTAERFSLSIENASVRQVLEVIAAQTGLAYFIESDGIRFTRNTLSSTTSLDTGGEDTARIEAAAKAMQDMRSNPIIGQIIFPNDDGTQYAFFVREDDLPPDLNELRKSKIRDAATHIRKVLHTKQAEE